MNNKTDGSAAAQQVAPDGKVSMKVKLGYGFGIFGDTIGNTLFYSYYSYFMTNIAMVLPITVGIISMIGVFWDAITDPVIAYMNGKRPLNKQASLMMIGTIPYVAALIATFIVPGGLTGITLSIYYILAALILILGYTFYCIPYYSLHPQLTRDYTERTNIASVRSYLNTAANLVAAVLPMLMVTYFSTVLGTERMGWFATVALLSLLVFISGFVGSRTISGAIKRNGAAEQTENSVAAQSRKNIFMEFVKGMKIKTNRRALIAIVIFMISSAMHRTGGAFYITTVCGFPQTVVSLVGMVGLLSWLVLIPIGNKIVQKYDLRRAILVLLGMGIVGRVAFYFIGVNSLAMAVVYYLFCACSDVACYTFMYSLGPDGFLLDELVFGYDRTPICHSVSTFGLKIANAIGLFAWTAMLQVAGYKVGLEATQVASTVSTMHFWFTMGVAILGAISWILYFKYPISRKKYNELWQAVQDQRTTGDFDHSVIDGLV